MSASKGECECFHRPARDLRAHAFRYVGFLQLVAGVYYFFPGARVLSLHLDTDSLRESVPMHGCSGCYPLLRLVRHTAGLGPHPGDGGLPVEP